MDRDNVLGVQDDDEEDIIGDEAPEDTADNKDKSADRPQTAGQATQEETLKRRRDDVKSYATKDKATNTSKQFCR